MAAPRFAADVMLGKLARWLRMLGYDTTYHPKSAKPALLRLARAEDRIILTMDIEVLRHGRVEALQIYSHDPREQLAEVTHRFPLPEEAPSRCPLCNSLLLAIKQDEIAELPLPLYVKNTQKNISHCLTCGKYYWPGSHRAQFKRFETSENS